MCGLPAIAYLGFGAACLCAQSTTSPPMAVGNTLHVPGGDPVQVWTMVAELVGAHYPLERCEPPTLADGMLQPGIVQSYGMLITNSGDTIGVLQRRWIGALVRPQPQGCNVELSVFIENEGPRSGVDLAAKQWSLEAQDRHAEAHFLGALQARLSGTVSPLAPPPVVLDAPNETVPIVVSDHRSRARTAFDNLLQDERNFYSLPSLGALTAAFGAGAIMANTNIDQNLNDDYQNHVGYQSDIHAFKTFGEGTYMIPAYFA
ncbi:MAG TPA: hypothetical protein VHV77_11225, partial [Pirellulales bacterium]|nr:hypothetical protein [Pirellulales bacterium]